MHGHSIAPYCTGNMMAKRTALLRTLSTVGEDILSMFQVLDTYRLLAYKKTGGRVDSGRASGSYSLGALGAFRG